MLIGTAIRYVSSASLMDLLAHFTGKIVGSQCIVFAHKVPGLFRLTAQDGRMAAPSLSRAPNYVTKVELPFSLNT